MEPAKIVYDEIIDKDTYVIGIAHFVHPAGLGEFEMSVSGQREAVEGYAEQAVIYNLEFSPAPDNYQDLIEARRKSALAFRRESWSEQLNKLREVVDNADLPLLGDPGQLWRRGPNSGEPRKPKRLKEIDLTQDRNIEIRPIGNYEVGIYYRLLLDMHPMVAQGQSDIYGPSVEGRQSAWGATDAAAGNPDLYLYRGFWQKDSSTSSGAHDEVFGEGGFGSWRLYVYGQTTATYNISGDWILLFNG